MPAEPARLVQILMIGQPPTIRALATAMTAAWVMSCSSGQTPLPGVRPAPSEHSNPGLALDLAPFTEIDIPNDTRSGSAPPEYIPLSEWSPSSSGVYRSKIPTHGPREREARLFDRNGKPMSRGVSWKGSHVLLRTTNTEEPPNGVTLRSPQATARENRLNFAWSGTSSADDFVRYTHHTAHQTRPGLLIPAPGRVSARVEVPVSGELTFTPKILPSFTGDLPAGDGATLAFDVSHSAGTTLVWEQQLMAGDGPGLIRLNLSEWAGQTVTLTARTSPGETTTLDYVFIENPRIASRVRSPRRAILLFIDTLRPDHLPLYGYERDTAPWLSKLALQSTIYDEAYSVSPWTLPAYRAVLTGAHPWSFSDAQKWPGHLRAQGIDTVLFGANLYLSRHFGGDAGFGHHEIHHLDSATRQVDRAAEWLNTHPDRDAVLVLHIMDPHLPYEEPGEFRHRFAGAPPAQWPHGDSFLRSQADTQDPAARRWIIDRYDNNIAYADAQLQRLDAHLRPDDLIIVFSDHGEEFWDHGAFEHGHTLHQELVRIPLVIRGQGFEPGKRIDTPASILDIAPTLTHHFGIDWPSAGKALQLGETEVRPIPLGYPLYGFDRWGVIADGTRYETHAGTEQLTPLPRANVGNSPNPDYAPWRAALQDAHGLPAETVFRFGLRATSAYRPGTPRSISVRSASDRVWGSTPHASRHKPTLTRTPSKEWRIELPSDWSHLTEAYFPGTPPTAWATSTGPSMLGPFPIPSGASTQTVNGLEYTMGPAYMPILPRESKETIILDASVRQGLEQAGYLAP